MKVTVLMPVYNGEKHLAQAVKSVLNQSHKDFELLVVDDGSTDNSPQIIKDFQSRDSRIRLLSQENAGPGAARNRGLAESNTEWIFLMDDDDVMFDNRLESQLQFLEKNPDVRVASCRAVYIDDQGRTLGKTPVTIEDREHFQKYLEENEALGLFQPGVVMHGPTVEEVGGYRPQFRAAEDIDLWNRLAEEGHLILVQKEVLMKYRIHAGSVSTSNFMFVRMQYEWVRACMRARRAGGKEPNWEEFLEKWKSAPWWKKINRSRKIYAKYFYRQGGRHLLLRHLFRGAFHLMAASLLQPSYVINRLQKQIFSGDSP